MNKRIIGLTGGIATGKTTVADYLACAYNLPVLDADVYARDAVAPGSQVLAAIQGRYGEEIIQPDGRLNRQRLGGIIFADEEERRWLEGLIHPYVSSRLIQGIQETTAPTMVLVIPLLFEAQMTDLVTEIWVVRCSCLQQRQRLMERNHLSVEAAEARMSSQWSLETKAARADVVLDNSDSQAVLFLQVDAAMSLPKQ